MIAGITASTRRGGYSPQISIGAWAHFSGTGSPVDVRYGNGEVYQLEGLLAGISSNFIQITYNYLVYCTTSGEILVYSKHDLRNTEYSGRPYPLRRIQAYDVTCISVMGDDLLYITNPSSQNYEFKIYDIYSATIRNAGLAFDRKALLVGNRQIATNAQRENEFGVPVDDVVILNLNNSTSSLLRGLEDEYISVDDFVGVSGNKVVYSNGDDIVSVDRYSKERQVVTTEGGLMQLFDYRGGQILAHSSDWDRSPSLGTYFLLTNPLTYFGLAPTMGLESPHMAFLPDGGGVMFGYKMEDGPPKFGAYLDEETFVSLPTNNYNYLWSLCLENPPPRPPE